MSAYTDQNDNLSFDELKVQLLKKGDVYVVALALDDVVCVRAVKSALVAIAVNAIEHGNGSRSCGWSCMRANGDLYLDVAD